MDDNITSLVTKAAEDVNGGRLLRNGDEDGGMAASPGRSVAIGIGQGGPDRGTDIKYPDVESWGHLVHVCAAGLLGVAADDDQRSR